MSDVNLNNLNHSELKEQARILGIDFQGNPSMEALRGWIGKAIGVEEKPVAEAKPKAGWKKILIPESEKDVQPVFVGHNGKSYRIKRGEPALVPPEVISVLNDAIQVQTDARGVSRRVPSYNFQILG